MLVENTRQNAALVAAAQARVNADARMVNARAALWRLGGSGLLALGVGAGVALGLFGFSYVTERQALTDAEARITQNFLAALNNITLRTEGQVRLEDGGHVAVLDGGKVTAEGSVRIKDTVLRIDPNATVAIDPKANVRVDPTSTIRVEGKLEADPKPSVQQLATEVRPPSNPKSIVTNFTVFHTVALGNGQVVVTGWRYDHSEQQAPSRQYCYFSKSEGDLEAVVWLGYDGHFKQPKSSPRSLNLRAAYSNCVWR